MVAWVARELGRPVRWTETRYENLVAMTHGRAQEQTITIGGRRDGTVLAYRLEVLQDAGAYPRIGAILPSLTILMAPGPYDIPRAEAVATTLVTNTTPTRRLPGRGAARGDGGDRAGHGPVRGRDRRWTRRRSAGMNLLPPFTEPHETAFGALYDSGDYVAALDAVLDAADYDGAAPRAGRAPGPR